jgi:hypothetical protein
MRLAPLMNSLVRHNQTTFIKGRSIHDNFRSVQLYCHWLHARQHACILLKINIAKAFDSVVWPFLLEVLQLMGFPLSWRDWIILRLFSYSKHQGVGEWSPRTPHLPCTRFASR